GKKVWDSGKLLVGFGGEDGVRYGIVKGVRERGKKVGMIDLDGEYEKMGD
ncbi:arginase family protein, partial [Staphylococcus saprophyticus]